MKNFKKLANNALSASEMKDLKGGWYYGFSCSCGSSGFTGVGDLQDYQFMAQHYCTGQGPVNCEFYQV